MGKFLKASALVLALLVGGLAANAVGQIIVTPPGGAAAAGAAKPIVIFTAQANQPPASDAATGDTRNSHSVLDFVDSVTNETALFGAVLGSAYAGGGLTVEIYWMATTATVGDVVWLVAVERHEDDATDLDADNFAADNTVTTTTASASGEVRVSTITFTDGADMDSLAAGESFRLRVRRNAVAGGDDLVGDAELLRVVGRES